MSNLNLVSVHSEEVEIFHWMSENFDLLDALEEESGDQNQKHFIVPRRKIKSHYSCSILEEKCNSLMTSRTLGTIFCRMMSQT